MSDFATIQATIRTLIKDPAVSNFERLCAQWDKLQEIDELRANQQLLNLREALSVWPDEFRVCPDPWLSGFASEISLPKFSLVRRISSVGLLEIAHSGALDALFASSNLSFVRSLDLRLFDEDHDSCEAELTEKHFGMLAAREDVHLTAIELPAIQIESLRTLLRSPVLQYCRHLGFAWATIDPNAVIEELIQPDCPLRLESLDLNHTSHGPVGSPIFIHDVSLKKFMESTASSSIKTLRLSGFDLTMDAIQHLANARNASSLKHLEISSICRLRGKNAPIQFLAAAKHISDLKEITYNHSEAGDEAAELIANTRHLSENLTHLELHWQEIGASGARALAESQYLSNVRHLNLSLNQKIGEEGCLALADAHWMPNIIHLDLSCVAMTNSALDKILSSLTTPQFLNVGCNPLKPGALASIARSPAVAKVKTLHLRGIEFHHEEIDAFASSECLMAVERLDLSSSQQDILSLLIVRMANSESWRHLRWLDLSSCGKLSDEALIAIANSPHMSHLEVLRLGHNRITSAGVATLAASNHLSQLKSLDLKSNCICDEGLIALAKSAKLPNLKKLTMCNNRLSLNSRTALEASPLCRIRTLKLSQHHSSMPDGMAGLVVSYCRIPGMDST